MYKVCTGRYAAGLDAIVADILDWKKREEVSALQSAVPFVETSIAKRVFMTCESAWAYQTTAFLWGESQTGKTFALQEFQRRNNHGLSRFIRLPAGGSKMGVLRRIAAASAVTRHGTYDHILDNIIGATDSTNILIFDEVHQVFTTYQRFNRISVLEMIREIGDTAHCGVVFCGTNVLRDELMAGEARKLLEQFRRRSAFEVQLPDRAPVKDLDAIARAFNLPPAKAEARELIKHINLTSGLQQYTAYLRKAVNIAASQSDPVDWSHFIQAYDHTNALSAQ
jgi:DNA transposition AAA+ family ATPase